MAGYGLGFGSHSLSRQYAALGGNVPVTTLLPSQDWDGTAGSGYQANVPVDPERVSAKPVCRLLTPPNQYFSEELVVGVWAGANHSGSMLDDLGIETVIAHCEGQTFEINAPSFFLQEDANGNLQRYLGWYVVLQHPGTDGHMEVYFEAVPKDPSMQNRVVGPFQFSPQTQVHDYEIEVAETPSEVVGVRYKTLVSALNYLTSVGAQNPLVTITESFSGDIGIGNLYLGGEGYCTIVATQPVTFRKSGLSLGAAALFRPRVNGLWFKGANITFDFHYASAIYHEPGSDRQHVFDGVTFTDSGGRYYTYLGGSKPILYISRGNPWFMECSISAIQDACQNASLVRGCQLTGGNRDVASAARCVIGNTISDWSSDEWREEYDALSLQYTGSASSATIELSGGNEASSRTLTAREDGVEVATFTIERSEAAFSANSNYTIANVASWLNSLVGWSASVLDNSRRAAALSVPNNQGAAFPATDAKSAPLRLVTMFDEHADLWAHNAASSENIVFADNACFNNVVQSVFPAPPVPTPLKDCIIINNAFDLDESSPDFGLLISQVLAPCSHVVLAHNTWSNQILALRSDTTFNPDTYCLVANNVAPAIVWGAAADNDLAITNNHLFAGASTPSSSTGTVVGGTKESLLQAPSSGDFTPLGDLLASPKPPTVRFDIFGIARGIPVANGAAAGGGEVAPAITSSNPSGTYAEGSPVSGVLTANKPVTWYVAGDDSDAVSLSAQTGDWSLEATDFETKTNYDFVFTAIDEGGDSVDQFVAIAISDLDEIAPNLLNPIDSESGTNAAELTVETDESGGTLHWYLSASSSPPLAADLISGFGAVASGIQPVDEVGQQIVTVTGLAASTTYFAHFLHRDGAGNESAVQSGNGFETEAISSGSVIVVQNSTVLNTDSDSEGYVGDPFVCSGNPGSAVIAVVTGVQNDSQAPSDLSATLDGLAMTQVTGLAHSDGVRRPICAIFVIAELTAGAKVINVAANGGMKACTIVLAELSGVDVANLVANATALEGMSQSYSHTYTPNAAGNLVLSALAIRRGQQGPFSPDIGINTLADESTGDDSNSNHSTFVGSYSANGTAAVDVGASIVADQPALFLVAELNAA